MEGAVSSSFTGGGSNTAGQLPAISINKSSGTLTLTSIIRATNNWSYLAGTVDAGASTVVFAAALTVSGSHTLNAAEIRGAATIASGTTLTLSSTLNMPSSTTFTVDGSAIVLGGLSLTDGSIAGAGVVHAQADITQASTFDGGTGTIAIDGTGNQTLTGGGSATAGSLPNLNVNKPSGSLTLSGIIRTGGNWIHTAGTASAIPSTVVFAGTTTQSLGGTAVTTFDNLTVDNISGLTLSPGPVIVAGSLTFTNGTITTGASKVVLSPGGSLVRVGGHVNGNLQKRLNPGAAVTGVFEIGDASNYLPVTLLFGNVTGAGDLTVGMIPTNHPDIATSGLQASRTIPRYWTMTNSGVAFDNCSSTLQFAAADVPTGADPNQFIAAKKDAVWTIPSIAAKGPTFIQTSGMTSFSDFAVGEAFTGPTTLSRASGNNQIGAIGMALGSPLVVTVTDSGNTPLAGISVTFSIASSPLGAVGQSLTVTSALTNASGQASTTLRLGSGTGLYSVAATAAGLTGSVTFSATAVLPAPIPEITGFEPERIVAGTLRLRLRVIGSNFVAGSVVRWNGSDRATSYVSSSQLTVEVSDSDLYSARSVTITVFNPTPAGGLSAPESLTIHAPAPVINEFDPATVTVGSAEIALFVYGERFETGSIVRWNGSDRATSYVSSRQLSARILSSDLAKTGSARITVFNPSFGGELSNEQVFAVMPPPELRSLSLNPSSPHMDAAVVGTISLSVPAPTGGITITLLSSDAALAATPKMLVIPAGLSSATFEILTSRVEEPTSVIISGSYQSVTLTANLVLGKSGQQISPAQLFVPIVLSAAGMSGSFYTTELTLVNRGSTPAVVDFDYTATLGTGSGAASDILPARQQRIIPDAIAYLKSIGVPVTAGGDHGGPLKVRFSGVSDPTAVIVIARTTTLDPRGRAGLAYSGVRPSELLQGTAYLCGLRQDERDRSNVALQNAGDPSEGNIVLRLTVFSGDALASSSAALPEVELKPGEFRQINGILTTNGLDLTTGYVRVERVQGSAPFYAYAVINDQLTSDGSFVPPYSAGGLKPVAGVTIPVIVENSGFHSELALTNLSDSARTLLLKYVADGIRTADSAATFSVEIKPGQQLHYPDLVSAFREAGVLGIGPTGDEYVGALFVKALEGDTRGVFVGARTSTSGSLHYGLSYVGTPSGRAATESHWIYGLQQNDQNRTNLSLVNTGETGSDPDTFQLEFFDGDTGEKVGTLEEIVVEAGRWIQIGSVMSRYAPGTQSAYVRITKKAGTNPFLAYAVINDGERPGLRTGDGAFLASHAAQ